MTPQPLISFIIPTYNSSRYIETLLSSIKRQNSKDIEIIIADNNSTDNTILLARKYNVKIVQFKGKPPQVAKQRNMGAIVAHGVYLYFIDHDMELSSNFIKSFQKIIKKSEFAKIDAWYIPEKIISSDPLYSTVRNFEASFIENTVVCAARLIKHSFFNQTEGYDENLSAGPADWDFDIQLRLHKALFGNLKVHVYHHEENLTIMSYIIKKTDYIPGEEIYKNKWIFNPTVYKNIIIKQYSLKYRIIGIFLENNKWKKLTLHIKDYLLFLIVKLSMAAYYEFWRRKNEI